MQHFPSIPQPLLTALAENEMNYALLPSTVLRFDPVFRTFCKENTCGRYGRCWTCPPDVGEEDELRSRLMQYPNILVLAKTYPIEDGLDLDGMLEAGQAHNRLALKLQRISRQVFPNSLTTGAGACTLCESCTRIDNLPCRYPTEALVSLEAHGVDVLALSKAAGLSYQQGKNTVVYFSSISF